MDSVTSDTTRRPIEESAPETPGRVRSKDLLTFAGMTEHDPRSAYALLERAVTERAVRVLSQSAAGAAAHDLPAGIPRRIVQYWHAEAPPEDVRRAIGKVRRFNPDMDCALFYEHTARAFIARHFGPQMQSLFDLCFHHTMKSDLFRLCYLHVHGGIYIDVDIDCYAPLTGIFNGNDFRSFLFYAEGKPWCIENGFIAVEPQNGFVAAMLDTLASNLARYRDGHPFRGIWAETGPGVATETIMRLFARSIRTGDDATLIDSLLIARNNLSAISYCHDELQYKLTAEGNWRKAAPPTGSKQTS